MYQQRSGLSVKRLSCRFNCQNRVWILSLRVALLHARQSGTTVAKGQTESFGLALGLLGALKTKSPTKSGHCVSRAY